MPLELGLFLGARAYGGRKHTAKACIIFDRDQHRFPRYISDIAGQDVHAHGGAYGRLIRELAGWLRMQSKDDRVPGGAAIVAEFDAFRADLPRILAARRLDPLEVTFGDYATIVAEYLRPV